MPEAPNTVRDLLRAAVAFLPGDEAHASFRRTYDELGPAARAHVGELVGQEVPAADESDPAA